MLFAKPVEAFRQLRRKYEFLALIRLVKRDGMFGVFLPGYARSLSLQPEAEPSFK